MTLPADEGPNKEKRRTPYTDRLWLADDRGARPYEEPRVIGDHAQIL